MPNQARHAYGKLDGVDNALKTGVIDAYDVLFLDGDTEPKIGWVDKNGNARIVKSTEQVVTVTELPTSDGKENVIYLCNDEAYIWNGNECVAIGNDADVSAIETDVANLKTEMENKIDADTVDNKIETAISSLTVDVVEF